jgi:hypothetical protein
MCGRLAIDERHGSIGKGLSRVQGGWGFGLYDIRMTFDITRAIAIIFVN